MKPESVKYLFECYLKEKQGTPSCDVVDGVSFTSTTMMVDQGLLAGEPSFDNEGGFANAPLEPEQEELARAFGRHLSIMSDEFELDYRTKLNQPVYDGNNAVQFQKRCVFVSPSSDKVEIPIVRLGNSEEELNVSWSTRNKTAFAGVHYVQAEGNILFKKFEANKIIEVKLLRKHQIEDVSFVVELLNSDFSDIYTMNSITVNILDHESLYPEERLVVNNITGSQFFSLDYVTSCLLNKVTKNTFKTALIYACSNADSVHQEFALGLELLRRALSSGKRESLVQIVCNFFKGAPELDDLDIENVEQ